jgi:hypothetical protein
MQQKVNVKRREIPGSRRSLSVLVSCAIQSLLNVSAICRGGNMRNECGLAIVRHNSQTPLLSLKRPNTEIRKKLLKKRNNLVRRAYHIVAKSLETVVHSSCGDLSEEEFEMGITSRLGCQSPTETCLRSQNTSLKIPPL